MSDVRYRSGMIGVLEEWIAGGVEIPRSVIADGRAHERDGQGKRALAILHIAGESARQPRAVIWRLEHVNTISAAMALQRMMNSAATKVGCIIRVHDQNAMNASAEYMAANQQSTSRNRIVLNVPRVPPAKTRQYSRWTTPAASMPDVSAPTANETNMNGRTPTKVGQAVNPSTTSSYSANHTASTRHTQAD